MGERPLGSRQPSATDRNLEAMATNLFDLRQQLRQYGARDEDVILLDGSATPSQKIRYLDLVRGTPDGAPWPQGVIEAAGQPVLYVLDGTLSRPEGLALAPLCRMLACRAGADHLALIEPGRITIYPVGLSELQAKSRIVQSDDPDAAGLVPTLAAPTDSLSELSGGRVASAIAIHDLLIDLLTKTTEALTRHGIGHLDALSLVGRALFVRFLADRRIVAGGDIAEFGTVEKCFDSADSSAKTSKWLDETFNGDFLPLPQRGSRSWFRSLDVGAFKELGKILSRADAVGQLHLGWEDLRFDHIPVGLLSQVYENHAHRFDSEGAKRTSVLYTPRHIAAYMVDEVFFALDQSGPTARILDPSAGGGVFLVEAFRRIVAARWQADGVRPQTALLREILYKQIRGFDISEPALRLCSLGLYLTALELDPSPRPISGLRFSQPLLGTVLHNVGAATTRHTYIGSLGGAVGAEHRHQYDVVLGNPPWSSWSATKTISDDSVQAQVEEVEGTIRTIVRERLGEDAGRRYSMLDKVPDLPFVWRAMEWAKPDGCIAFALHGRLLFKQSEQGLRSRSDLMHALTVTGLVNGAAVRQSPFWPNVAAPFCLLFARNRLAGAGDSFWFVSPLLEDHLQAKSRWRIDAASARSVALSDLEARPTLLKTLFRGTELDAQVVERINAKKFPTLVEYWTKEGGALYHGQGFKIGGKGPTSRLQKPAQDLWGMRMLGERPSTHDLDMLDLPCVEEGFTCQHPRKRTIYQSPLILVGETPPRVLGETNVYLALEKDVAFNQSFRGFSCAWHRRGELLARYVSLVLSSCLPVYRALLTSGKFGVERDIYEGDDLLKFPMPPLEALSEESVNQILPLSEGMIEDPAKSQAAVDAWAAKLYDLGRKDLQVISDTMEMSAPFARSQERAQIRPTKLLLREYVRCLAATVRAFVGRHGRDIELRVVRDRPGEPWIVMQLDAYEGGEPPLLLSVTEALSAITEDADSLGASRVIVVAGPGQILLATVAQSRYFTLSRARLLGLELVHEQSEILLGVTKL